MSERYWISLIQVKEHYTIMESRLSAVKTSVFKRNTHRWTPQTLNCPIFYNSYRLWKEPHFACHMNGWTHYFEMCIEMYKEILLIPSSIWLFLQVCMIYSLHINKDIRKWITQSSQLLTCYILKLQVTANKKSLSIKSPLVCPWDRSSMLLKIRIRNQLICGRNFYAQGWIIIFQHLHQYFELFLWNLWDFYIPEQSTTINHK